MTTDAAPTPPPVDPAVRRRRTWLLVVFLVAIFSTVPLMIALLSIPARLQRGFCPADSWVTNHLLGAGTVLGALALGFTPFLAAFAAVGLETAKPMSKWKFQFLGIVAAGAFGLGAWGWGTDLFNYFCATPREVIVHHVFEDAPAHYAWSDVRWVRAACVRGKGGVSYDFDLRMADGTALGLGGESWWDLEPHYRQVGALVRNAAYDNSHVAACPERIRQIFAAKPGS